MIVIAYIKIECCNHSGELLPFKWRVFQRGILGCFFFRKDTIYIRKNAKKIIKSAKVLYSKRKSGEENRVVQNCLDFIAVEKECDRWENRER